MQQVQLRTLAVFGGTWPELGKKNSSSLAAEAGLSEPCTALQVLSGTEKQQQCTIKTVKYMRKHNEYRKRNKVINHF